MSVIKLKQLFIFCIFLILAINILVIVNKSYGEVIKIDNVHYFNIEEFNRNKNNSNEWAYYSEDGAYVRKYKTTVGYIEQFSMKTSPYNSIRAYDKNGEIIEKLTQFYGMKIKLEHYKSGKLIKVSDCNEIYKLSIDDLKFLMMEKFNFDIMNADLLRGVNRYILPEINIPVYEVLFSDHNRRGQIHCVLINGMNGEVLYQTERSAGPRPREKVLPLYEEYLRSIKTHH